MKTIQEVKALCLSNNLNPKRVFIASNGTIMTEWHSAKQSARASKVFDKYLTSLGSKNAGPEDCDVTGTDMEDWEEVAYTEMHATRH